MSSKGIEAARTHISARSPQRQRGAAMVVMLSLLVLMSSAGLYARLKSVPAFDADREAASSTGLAEAKASLIASAVSANPASGRRVAPGLLPFPDRSRDGNYDGRGDCVTFGLNNSHLLGRFPWVGDVSPCPRIGLNIDARDGAGEHLWYAVSRNLVTRGSTRPVNSDMGGEGRMIHPWITIRKIHDHGITDPDPDDAPPVAAVIIAPGAVLDGQDRSGAAPKPVNFLDRITVDATTYSNADADGCPDSLVAPCASSPAGEEFIAYSNPRASGVFNDRLVTITVNELTRAVEKRVLGEAAMALNAYRRAYGVYPWLARFRNPRVVTPENAGSGGRLFEPSFKSTLSRRGQLPVHLPSEIFATSFGGSWRFVDATPTTGTKHSGDPMLIPRLRDVERGLIHVAGKDGRCLWTDWTRVDCTGTSIVPAYFRSDLGITVTRTVEYAFSLVDDSPTVTPPAPADVRRRTLSIRAAPLPVARFARLSEGKWTIRITDDNGINRGQRDFTIDSDTAGAITVSGIRFDLSVVYDDIDDERDELPEWFAENNWHHFIYAALSSDAVAGGDADGDGDCRTPVNTCLTLNVDGTAARSDVRALLVSAGAEWAHQDRSNGDCDGDGIGDDFLCAYFEGDNSDRSTVARSDTYASDKYSVEFNDQIRIVAPLPP